MPRARSRRVSTYAEIRIAAMTTNADRKSTVAILASSIGSSMSGRQYSHDAMMGDQPHQGLAAEILATDRAEMELDALNLSQAGGIGLVVARGIGPCAGPFICRL